MFYIDTHALIRKREVLLLHILPTVVVFCAFMGVTFLSWSTSKANSRDEQFHALEQENDETSMTLSQRIDAYADILRGAAGFFTGSNTVTTEEWQLYLSSYDITNRYPGIQGVGYAEIIPKHELSAHTERIRNEGRPTYTVFPGGERDIYTSVVFLEPSTNENTKAFGYDMYTDPLRRKAMDKARDSGTIALSDIVTLVQDADEATRQPGFIMYMPVYRKLSSQASVYDRRANIIGYISAPFRAHDFINKTLPAQTGPYAFQLYSLSGEQKQLVYESQDFAKLAANPGKQQLFTEFALADATWQLVGVAAPEIIGEDSQNRLSATFWGGFIFSFFVAGFIYLLLANRANALASKEARGIQAAKDELLALASHQLRTPATGVKQYVGMLREGFAGKVTPMQQKLLDKAFESNERQLNTINHMLFVARADAGELKMVKDKINLNNLVRDIMDEHASSIKIRQQKVTLKLPKQATYIRGDRQYLRMAFENIISNASKYTREGGKISVTLRVRGPNAIFRVADSGVGVSREDLRLLFKKFSRVPNELTNQVSGSGIGLYLAHKVVDAHKGEISFASAPEKGSTVTISLPKIKPKKKSSAGRRLKRP